MSKQRADLGFGDELDNFDPNAWTPSKASAANDRTETKKIQEAAQALGFRSREPRPDAPARERRRRTGRNAQFNIKARPETIEAFCEVADANGWGLGETLEYAVDLLQEAYLKGQGSSQK